MFHKKLTAIITLFAVLSGSLLFPMTSKADEMASEKENVLTEVQALEKENVVFKDFPVAGVAACVADGVDYKESMEEQPIEVTEADVQTVVDVFKPNAVCAVGDYIYLRSLPQDSACDPVGIFYHNAVAEVLEVEGEWTKVRSGNVTGYLLSEFLLTGEEAQPIIEAAKVVTGTVNTENLAMRMGPDEKSELIEILPLGEEVVVYETVGDWVRVRSEEGEGYVFASFLKTKASYITALTNEEVSAQEKLALRKEMEEKARRGIAYNALNGKPSHFVSREDSNVHGREVAEFALQFVGNPYVWGGVSLTDGCDCSGFVMSVYKEFGFTLTHSTEIDQTEGIGIASIEEAEAGDIICYQGHVAIYIGDGMVVHAAGTGKGIRVDMACFDNIITVRRMFED